MTYPAPKSNPYQRRLIEFLGLDERVDKQRERSRDPNTHTNEDNNELLLRRIRLDRLLARLAIPILIQALTLHQPRVSQMLPKLPHHRHRGRHHERRRRVLAKREQIRHRLVNTTPAVRLKINTTLEASVPAGRK